MPDFREDTSKHCPRCSGGMLVAGRCTYNGCPSNHSGSAARSSTSSGCFLILVAGALASGAGLISLAAGWPL